MEKIIEPNGRAALATAGEPLTRRFVRDNRFCGQRRVLRGPHSRLPPHAEAKLVRVLKDLEGATRWDDPKLAIDLPGFGVAPRLAPKDATSPDAAESA
ncbi:MAG: hypothetical protein ACK57B_12295 [Betaproteobacteria bacterium]